MKYINKKREKMNKAIAMTARRKYPKFNTILLEIKTQGEYDTMRTALLTLASVHPIKDMVRFCDSKTTPEKMVFLANDMRTTIEKT